ncbi:hypothetical protein CAEBREN_09646 [Caenorhabditis brenneri]|uniref:F-box domain-containing protein n=1 Tax=Caenorhabditis brenneri TaxID=135651 RepID=G0NVN9_CAEBE|nr:hypothetical protein CAEBREN_09646 [Caenorhabditis brenneri]
MLPLIDLMRLSFLSKRSKRMIKHVLPTKKAQYDCKVWYKENSHIEIKSRFGRYSGFESNIGHVIEVLSYPPIQVVVYGGNPVTRAAEWIKRNQNWVRTISFSPSFKSDRMITMFVNPSIERNGQIETISSSTPLKDREIILEFVNPLIKLNVRIDLGEDMVVTCSPEEVRIENLNFFPISFLWSLICQKLRIVDGTLPVLVVAHGLISIWALKDIRGSSTIRQLIFELTETEKIEQWILKTGWEKSEEEWQHPIYGEINEWYKHKDGNDRTEAILFEVCHDGKRLLVMNIGHVYDLLDCKLYRTII